MEQPLWAPWRMEFIRSEKPTGCIFCEFPAAPPADDREEPGRAPLAHAFTCLNRYPYNSGHVMVIPRAHVAELSALGAGGVGGPAGRAPPRGRGGARGLPARGAQRRHEPRPLRRARASSTTCTGTSSRAGSATTTSCRSWPTCGWWSRRSTRPGSGSTPGSRPRAARDARLDRHRRRLLRRRGGDPGRRPAEAAARRGAGVPQGRPLHRLRRSGRGHRGALRRGAPRDARGGGHLPRARRAVPARGRSRPRGPAPPQHAARPRTSTRAPAREVERELAEDYRRSGMLAEAAELYERLAPERSGRGGGAARRPDRAGRPRGRHRAAAPPRRGRRRPGAGAPARRARARGLPAGRSRRRRGAARQGARGVPGQRRRVARARRGRGGRVASSRPRSTRWAGRSTPIRAPRMLCWPRSRRCRTPPRRRPSSSGASGRRPTDPALHLLTAARCTWPGGPPRRSPRIRRALELDRVGEVTLATRELLHEAGEPGPEDLAARHDLLVVGAAPARAVPALRALRHRRARPRLALPPLRGVRLVSVRPVGRSDTHGREAGEG